MAGLSLVCTIMLGWACAYPRKSTPVSVVPNARSVSDAPADLWRLLVVSAEIPREKRSGLAWDGGDPPDPYVRLVVDGKKLWQSKTVQNALRPEFDDSPPKNLAIAKNTKLRLELWDADGVSADPIGMYEGRALGSAIEDADTIVKLEGGATLTVRVQAPIPHRGVGIANYELHKDALRVIEVMKRSPAERAGLVAGDRIVAIDGQSIVSLGAQRAETALVQASQNQSELRVVNGEKTRVVKLDDGYIWLSL